MIPHGIYDFLEAMSNVESAAAAGDSYKKEQADAPATRWAAVWVIAARFG